MNRYSGPPREAAPAEKLMAIAAAAHWAARFLRFPHTFLLMMTLSALPEAMWM